MRFFRKDMFHYGWVVIGVSTIVMIGFYGTELSFGVFLKPILEELGGTRTMVSGAMSMVIGVSAPVGIITGRLTDKYGSRIIIAIGALFAVLGYVSMYGANSLWHIYLFFGLPLGICLGTCWAPLVATASRWFTEERVLAIGILTSGLTLGSMLVPPFIAHFITVYGWRVSFLILALIIIITTIPAIFLLGSNPQKNTNAVNHNVNTTEAAVTEAKKPAAIREWSAMEAAKTIPFSMVLAIGFVTAAGFFLIAAHIVAYATDMGIGSSLAALILSFLSIGNIVGKLLVWPISKRVKSRFTLVLFVGLQAFSLFLLMKASSLWMLFILGSIFGFGLGGSMTIRMSIIPEFFGTKAVGTLVGIAGIAWGLGGIVGPILAGYIFDISSSYDVAFLTGGFLLIVGMVAAFFLKAPVSGLEIHPKDE